MASNYLIAHLKSHTQVGMSHPRSQQQSQNIYLSKKAPCNLNIMFLNMENPGKKQILQILLCVGDNSTNSSPMLYQSHRQPWGDSNGCRACSVMVPNPSRGWWPSSFAAMLRGEESCVKLPWSCSESTPFCDILWWKGRVTNARCGK